MESSSDQSGGCLSEVYTRMDRILCASLDCSCSTRSIRMHMRSALVVHQLYRLLKVEMIIHLHFGTHLAEVCPDLMGVSTVATLGWLTSWAPEPARCSG